MLNLFRSPSILVVIFTFVIVTNRLYSQKLEWSLSDGGHMSEMALNVEKVPGGVVFLSSDGLEKRNEAGVLLWKFDFFELDDLTYSAHPTIGPITTDEFGNIYAKLIFPSKGPGPTTIKNIDIPHGNSLIKINANGKLLWCKKIEGSKKTILQYSKGHIYVVGVFEEVINIADTYSFENRENSDCPTGSSDNIYARDIFLAKFNTIGQVQDVVLYDGIANDDLEALTMDRDGNLYIAVNYGSSCTPYETQIHKIDPDLGTVWSKTISKAYEEGNGGGVLHIADIHVGVNGKLYLWAYTSGSVISKDFRFIKTAQYGYTAGLLEYTSHDASFLNYRSFDGFTFKAHRAYMADYKGNLLVATSFRETQEFDNGNLSTLNPGEEPVLLKVDLNNFSIEYLLHLTGIPQQYFTDVKDWSGPIQMNGDNLYYSGSFSSGTLNVTPEVELQNHSGNNDLDYFLLKYDFSEVDVSSIFEDTDLDGVSNAMDLCPDSPLNQTVDEHGCGLAQKDTDLDGVMDDIDICPETPSGSEVDQNGCSNEQIDTDFDGVPDFRDNCPQTRTGVPINEEGCEILLLNPALFKIETVGEACPGSANGSVSIITEDISHVYRAVLNKTEEISFTAETRFEGLGPGQYELCLLANEMDSDTLCYTLTIKPGAEISITGKVDLDSRTLKVELAGGTSYKVSYNGRLFETLDDSLELDLKKGVNEVLVSTDHICQGQAVYRVDFDMGLGIAPNPFTDRLDLSHLLGAGRAEVLIYNQSGQQVYHRRFSPGESRVLQDLSRLPSGIYLLDYSDDKSHYSQKIIKI